MTKLLLSSLFLVVVMSLLVVESHGACTCNVRSNGEYCGTELNRINGNQDCARDQYLCGNSNRNKAAVVVKKCRAGFECDVSRNGYGNSCLMDIDCHCPSSLSANGRNRYCGNRLTGRDCSANVVRFTVTLPDSAVKTHRQTLNFFFFSFRCLLAAPVILIQWTPVLMAAEMVGAFEQKEKYIPSLSLNNNCCIVILSCCFFITKLVMSLLKSTTKLEVKLSNIN